jgi:hypothetical protein
MMKHLPSIIVAICIATFSLIWVATAQAKQQCSATPSGHAYWSWRIVDGRKCWYEGKPMLSKALLEWPAQTSDQPDPGRELARTVEEKPGDPLDSQAWAPSTSDTFEALWRHRIEQH